MIWPHISAVPTDTLSFWWVKYLNIYIPAINDTLAQIASVLLLTLQAYLLSVIANRYRLVGQPSFMPGLFYIAVANFIPPFLYLTPILVANTFVLLMLSQLMDSYRRNEANILGFNTGLFAAMAALFFPPYIWLVLFLLFTYISLRGLRIKELFTTILGVMAVLIITVAIVMWTSNREDFWSKMILPQFGSLQWIWTTSLKPLQFVNIGVFVVLSLFGVLGVLRNIKRRDMIIQKMINLQFWMIVFGVLILLFRPGFHDSDLQLFAIPLGMFLAISMSSANNQASEFIHLAMLLFIIFYQLGLGFNYLH